MTEIEVRGADELARTLKRAGADLADLTETNAKAADTIAGRARTLAPRLTGRLAASVRVDAAPTQARIFATAVYAGPIHYGWPARHIRPQPFLTEAATTTTPAWTNHYRREVEHVVGRVHGA